jgi:hypothetical protein
MTQLAASSTTAPRRAAAQPIPCRLFTEDGEEVFITQICTKCGLTKPLKAFGLRRVGRKLRSISQCKACRSNPGVPVLIVVREEPPRAP